MYILPITFIIFLYIILIWCSVATRSTVIHTDAQVGNEAGKYSTTEATKSNITKREPEAQRREHSFNPDGTVNYHGSGSGHDSGDLVPPPGGSVFNSPSIELTLGHTGSSGPGLSNSYGVPIPADSYGPPKIIFDNKPPSAYGPPLNVHAGLPPPKPVYGPPKHQFKPQSLPKPVYGPPVSTQYGPPKPTYGPPKQSRKPSFSSRPKPVYGPPKPTFASSGFSQGTLLSPVSSIKSHYGPPKVSSTYGTPLQPSTSYGTPHHSKPSHIKAPPTPPDVTYDGWKPIPGLVSQAPSASFGNTGHSGSGGIDFSNHGQISTSGFDGIAPPSTSYGTPHVPSSTYGTPSFGSTSFGVSGLGIQLQPSSSYGPPQKPSSTYGTPLQPSTSYGPPIIFKDTTKGSFLSSLKPPSSSYGPPTAPSISYGPPKAPSISYGPPKIPSLSYGPPKTSSISFGPPKFKGNSFGLSKPSSISYGPPPKFPSSSSGPAKLPSLSYGPPKAPSSSYGPPKPPSSSYGPPKPPSSSYGPPKPPSSSYGPPKPPSNSYGPPKPPSSSYGPPKPPSISYGPPKAPSSSYGAPNFPSISYGPPKILSNSFDLPKPPSSFYGAPQIFTTYSIPKPGISVNVAPISAYRGPPVPHPLQPPTSYSAPSFSGGLYKTPLPPNALYGVPTAPAPPLSVGCCGPPPSDLSFQGPSSYSVPNSNVQTVQQVSSIEISSHGNQLVTSGLGFGISGAAPSPSYGTPLFPPTQASAHHQPSTTYGVPTALPLRQPKNPVKFRPPVPAGLISSIGAKWGDSAVWGGNAHANKFHGDTYIPPAVPDPDPGIHANQGNPLVIPPPSAPPINYGPPAGNQHHEVHHHQASTSLANSGDGDLNPPPPPVSHGHDNYDIQQSASVELSGSTNLGHNGVNNQFSSETITSYNAPVNTAHHHDLTGSAPGGQSYSDGVQNIPIKGSQGSYTLQIQPAGGNSGEQISHGEVLSNGLLQDILAAIENPTESDKLQQYGSPQSSDPVASEIGLNILKQLGGTITQQSNSIQLPTQYGTDLSHASSSNIALYTKNSDSSNEIINPTNFSKEQKENSANITGAYSGSKIAQYLNQNKIALYYNNQAEGIEDRKGDTKDILLVQMSLPNSTNSESQSSEFGTLVSVKLQNAQNEYAAGITNSTVIRSSPERDHNVS